MPTAGLPRQWRSGVFDQPPIGFTGKAELEVITGTADLSTITEQNVHQVARIIVHPKYTEASRSGHDIALVELSKPWNGPLAHLSARRSDDPETPPGSIAMVAGFGDQKWQASLKLFANRDGSRVAAGSRVLREVDLPTIAAKECRARYKGSKVGPEQICAGHLQGRKDSCQGDSGGPLVAFDRQGCPYQIGIVSWGPECASEKAYGVYTRVSAYIDWIRKYVPATQTVRQENVARNDQCNRALEQG